MKNEKEINVDETIIQWKEFRSKNGRKFEVGYLEKDDLLKNEKAIQDSDEGSFGIAVNWPVGDAKWKDTTPEVERRASIKRYRLYGQPSGYDYRLDFTNTKHYNYEFFDESGDSYTCDTFRNADHYVRFDSGEPKIVFIKGS